jgi:hypothetical protein
MNLKFTDEFEKLKELLKELNGTWEESRDDKKVFRRGDGIMNWFPSTGTRRAGGVDKVGAAPGLHRKTLATRQNL